MNLSKAVAGSNETLRKAARLALGGDMERATYWANELNIAMTAQTVAIQQAIRAAKIPETSRLRALMLSIERESRKIAAVVQELTRADTRSKNNPKPEKSLGILQTHLRHHEVKGKYLEEHLPEFLSEAELQALGDEFLREYETISGQMHLMDFEK